MSKLQWRCLAAAPHRASAMPTNPRRNATVVDGGIVGRRESGSAGLNQRRRLGAS